MCCCTVTSSQMGCGEHGAGRIIKQAGEHCNHQLGNPGCSLSPWQSLGRLEDPVEVITNTLATILCTRVSELSPAALSGTNYSVACRGRARAAKHLKSRYVQVNPLQMSTTLG